MFKTTLQALWVILMTVFPEILKAQEVPDSLITQGNIFRQSIHTAMVYRKGWPLSYPYLNLNGEEKLILEFDDLAEDPMNLSYTLIHCDASWNPTNIYSGDYLEGFADNPITNYRFSTNTTIPYIHYRIQFPNEDVNVTLSGNYIISVFEDGARSRVLLSQRFIVYENLVSIRPDVLQGQDKSGTGSGQQIIFDVGTSSFSVNDPHRDIKAVVLQNGDWSNARFRKSPDFAGGNKFSYTLSSGLVFPGDNEFRHFEMTDIRFISKDVADIRYVRPWYNVILKPGEFRRFKPYFYQEDLNGRFYIRNSRGSDPSVDADYVNVFFTLAAPFPVEGTDVYVFGGLSGWHLSGQYKMHYNMEQHQYELSAILKQGHYDYLFATVSPDSTPDLSRLEGSHFETENDYTIILYYAPPGSDYDRIIGLRTFNSKSK
ncbi:MAG: DUF5103 domain-containing protein [Chlorobi bacterium]|nr:DUF5103 domain-containing protein [Chlorobiota bacterium]